MGSGCTAVVCHAPYTQVEELDQRVTKLAGFDRFCLCVRVRMYVCTCVHVYVCTCVRVV